MKIFSIFMSLLFGVGMTFLMFAVSEEGEFDKGNILMSYLLPMIVYSIIGFLLIFPLFLLFSSLIPKNKNNQSKE